VPDGQRSEAFQSVVWHLAGKGLSADGITDELARHPNGIGAKYADRLHEEVLRSYGKWRDQRRANATGEEPSGAPWPSIYVVPGELPRVVDEAESALLGLGREIYQRGGMIVRPVLTPAKTFHDRDTEAWRILEVPKSHNARVDAVTGWLKAMGGNHFGALAKVLQLAPVAETVVGLEHLMHRYVSQGGGSFSGAHREPSLPGRVSQEIYDSYSYNQKLDYAAKFPQDRR